VLGPVAGAWGLFGGFAVEGLDMYSALRRYGCWPWNSQDSHSFEVVPEAGRLGYAVAELIRLLIGAGLAWAAVATGQISGPLGAIGVGVAAPTIIGQLAKAVPLDTSGSPHPTRSVPAATTINGAIEQDLSQSTAGTNPTAEAEK
jgi:apolipoprotein N-acyltransferase